MAHKRREKRFVGTLLSAAARFYWQYACRQFYSTLCIGALYSIETTCFARGGVKAGGPSVPHGGLYKAKI